MIKPANYVENALQRAHAQLDKEVNYNVQKIITFFTNNNTVAISKFCFENIRSGDLTN